MFVPLYNTVSSQIEPASLVKGITFKLWNETLSKKGEQKHKQVLRLREL